MTAPTIADTIATARKYLDETRAITNPREHSFAVAVAALADELHDTAHMLARVVEEQRNALQDTGVLLGAIKLRSGSGQ
jgi:hypothetical protein